MPAGAFNTDHARATLSRRCLLRLSLAAPLAPIPQLAEAARWRPPREWRLRLHNTATGEAFDDVYCVDGCSLPEALARLTWILRDHNTNQCRAIDESLLHRLFRLQCRLERGRPFDVLSAYRSPATNHRLAEAGLGASPQSLHLQGRAVDVRLPGCAAHALHRAALELGEGGIGYYPESGYVHLDTGAPRHWTGR
ncbi:DUF882 domain-containing protein [Azospirillum sp. TSO22-1]|uniref:YcbK family protein n=1 Tax=Azospirillum sp. TSO22-1 TaxID=716789 RepID=UPI000D61166E|nr:DUF882 domain-containing protein [Azospirillum sp. TSO22-1]PWC52444.1 hypothetical protein TSO221_14170 [Azospirillum sp. TSO22-1]